MSYLGRKKSYIKLVLHFLFPIQGDILSRFSYEILFLFLQLFLTKFHKTLNSESASSKELSLAIKGYGVFAQVP